MKHGFFLIFIGLVAVLIFVSMRFIPSSSSLVEVVADTPLSTTPQKIVFSSAPQKIAETGVATASPEVVAEDDWQSSQPEAPLFWDQFPDQKSLIEYFEQLQDRALPPIEKPEYIGQSDDGLDTYEFRTIDGANTTRWQRGENIVFERKILKNGDTLRFWSPGPEDPHYSFAFETKSDGMNKRVDFRANGTVASFWVEQEEISMIYDYNEQGRLIKVWKRNNKPLSN